MERTKVRVTSISNNADIKVITNFSQFLIYAYFLFNIVYETEQALPSDAGESATVWVRAPPDKDGLADDVVFWYEAPIAAVQRVVAVVALHPVVVKFEGVLGGLFVVDEYLAVPNL